MCEAPQFTNYNTRHSLLIVVYVCPENNSPAVTDRGKRGYNFARF
jgi:hypothetical protein